MKVISRAEVDVDRGWQTSKHDDTNHTFVRLLVGVYSHMNEQLVSRVEGSRARAPLPQTGELVFAARRRRRETLSRLFTLLMLVPVPLHPPAMAVRVRRGRLHVSPLYVPHQTLLLGERTAAIDPVAQVGRSEAVFRRFRAICNGTRVNLLAEDKLEIPNIFLLFFITVYIINI